MNSGKIKEMILGGGLMERFYDIYADEKAAAAQPERYLRAIERYEQLYGEGEVDIFSAPGRSEISGNHTDHQHGQVLAASVNLDAIAVTGARDDMLVKVVSDPYDEIVIDASDMEAKPEEEGTTAGLIRGVLAGAQKRGFKIGGFQSFITSDVLIGAGLSSSAAFETVIGVIISYLYNDGGLDAVTNAQIGQFAENVYFGKPCGLMDQMACSVGNLVNIDFADPKKPVINRVDFDMGAHGYSLCITDTKGSHADLTDEYAAIPVEMKKIAAYFGQDVCRGITREMIYDNISELRSSCGDRAVLRVMHFLAENERVGQAVAALVAGDTDAFLAQIKASGDSSFKYLQNVYTSSDVQHQNVSVALCVSDDLLSGGKGVCRVHGGGFAGTIQAFVKNEYADEYRKGLDRVFGEGACKVLKIRKYGGMKVI